MKDGGGVLSGLIFRFLCFIQCGAFLEYFTLCLKLKVKEDGTQFMNYVQEEIAISGFILWGFTYLFYFILSLNTEEFKNTLTLKDVWPKYH